MKYQQNNDHQDKPNNEKSLIFFYKKIVRKLLKITEILSILRSPVLVPNKIFSESNPNLQLEINCLF